MVVTLASGMLDYKSELNIKLVPNSVVRGVGSVDPGRDVEANVVKNLVAECLTLNSLLEPVALE